MLCEDAKEMCWTAMLYLPDSGKLANLRQELGKSSESCHGDRSGHGRRIVKRPAERELNSFQLALLAAAADTDAGTAVRSV
jgi:hypothetical protein